MRQRSMLRASDPYYAPAEATMRQRWLVRARLGEGYASLLGRRPPSLTCATGWFCFATARPTERHALRRDVPRSPWTVERCRYDLERLYGRGARDRRCLTSSQRSVVGFARVWGRRLRCGETRFALRNILSAEFQCRE